MFTNVWRRGRLAAVAGACTAGVLLAAGTAFAASAGGASAAQPQARVPWSQVGPGWQLVEYTNGTATHHLPTTLYLVNPAGARYAVYTWKASQTGAPHLIAWSGDKTRALFDNAAVGVVTQINLQTGKLTRFQLAGAAVPFGYTRPNGLQILGMRVEGRTATLGRYDQTGAGVAVLASNSFSGFAAVYSADGKTLAINGANGLRLITNTGVELRKLPVPGTNTLAGCWPVRYWNAGTILTECFAKQDGIVRLWLVPVSGARPTALTPQRTGSGPDRGDVDAWRLNSGLYPQGLGACDAIELFKQAANGSAALVKVPFTANAGMRVVTAAGNRLLLDASANCSGSGNSLLWFNPGTRAEQWLFKAPADALGVLAAVSFYSNENAM